MAFGIACRVGRLTQHIEGEAIALFAVRPRVAQRFAHCPAEHELAAQHAHGRHDSLPNHRLARPRNHFLDNAFEIPSCGLIHPHDASGQHQRPSRRIDEHRVGFAIMAVPIARADFIPNQPVRRVGVGHPQQRLRQAHQRHAFLGRKRIFLRKSIDAAALGAFGPNAGCKFVGQGLGCRVFGGRESGERDAFGRDRVFVGEINVGDGLSEIGGHELGVVGSRVHSSATLTWRANLLLP